jgi:hypothetical protein
LVVGPTTRQTKDQSTRTRPCIRVDPQQVSVSTGSGKPLTHLPTCHLEAAGLVCLSGEEKAKTMTAFFDAEARRECHHLPPSVLVPNLPMLFY